MVPSTTSNSVSLNLWTNTMATLYVLLKLEHETATNDEIYQMIGRADPSVDVELIDADVPNGRDTNPYIAF